MKTMEEFIDQAGRDEQLKDVCHSIGAFPTTVHETVVEFDAGKLPDVPAQRGTEALNFMRVWADILLDE